MIAPDRDGNLEFVYPVVLDKGKFIEINREAIKKELRSISGNWEWVLRKRRKKRSFRQNRTQYMYFNILSDHTGHTPHEIKGWAQFELLKTEEVDEATGEVYQRIKDTSELSTAQHSNFMEDLRQWGWNKFGCVLPLPDHTLAIDFKPEK